MTSVTDELSYPEQYIHRFVASHYIKDAWNKYKMCRFFIFKTCIMISKCKIKCISNIIFKFGFHIEQIPIGSFLNRQQLCPCGQPVEIFFRLFLNLNQIQAPAQQQQWRPQWERRSFIRILCLSYFEHLNKENKIHESVCSAKSWLILEERLLLFSSTLF